MNVGTKDCGHEIAMSTPSAGEAGTTGEWRTLRPTLEQERCLAKRQDDLVCQLCWVYCPDVCIQQGIPPTVDLAYCKGCGICAEICPVDAIRMVSEDAAAPDLIPSRPHDAGVSLEPMQGAAASPPACATPAEDAAIEGGQR